MANSLDEKYKDSPCYKTICEMRITEYNKNYNRLPWDYIVFNEEIDLENLLNENQK